MLRPKWSVWLLDACSDRTRNHDQSINRQAGISCRCCCCNTKQSLETGPAQGNVLQSLLILLRLLVQIPPLIKSFSGKILFPLCYSGFKALHSGAPEPTGLWFTLVFLTTSLSHGGLAVRVLLASAKHSDKTNALSH